MALSLFTRGLRKALSGAPDRADAIADERLPEAVEPLFPVPQGVLFVEERLARRSPPAPLAEQAARAPEPAPAVVQRPPLAAGPPAQPAQAASAATAPTVIVRPLGAMANRMIQHMVAMKIASLVPGARISRIHLPEWGIDEPDLADAPEPTIRLDHMYADVEGAAAALRDGRASAVEIAGYVQHMNNLLGPESYRHLFSSDMPVEAYGEDVLLINIRGAEILTGQYPPYVLVPIAFYRQIVRETGLRPVFFGQLSDCPYMDELRSTFPEATFRHGAGVIHDWEVLRRSKNICMSVSTFSWAACWLSEADRVFMPLTGLLNPVQGIIATDGHNLVPTTDNRFLFYNFPLNEGVPQDRYREIHGLMEGRWRPVSGAWITSMLARRQALERELEDHASLFDEDHYLGTYGELAMAKANGWFQHGRDHYVMHGFREGRLPCHIGMDYAYRYPDAGVAVANGEYLDLLHFHAARGRHLGYTTRPA